MRQKLFSIARRIGLPAICILCKQFHFEELAVCQKCIAILPTLGPCCKLCAYPLVDESYHLCGYCIKNPPALDQAMIRYAFEEPIRSLIHRFKYQANLYLGGFLAKLILNSWQKSPSYPECLIPVPLHSNKLRKRGFNQTLIITRILSQKLGIPLDSKLCQKIINTQPQAELPSNQRSRNIKQAFSIEKNNYRHVALVDDIFTTGSTVNEIARELKSSGVEKVEVWCCARARLKY